MGERDSSKTRVAPVFKRITRANQDPWLDQLLTLPTRFDGVPKTTPSPVGDVVDKAWGPDEKKLDPPESLLSWLVLHPERLTAGSIYGNASSETREKRRRLLAGDNQVRQEALRLVHDASQRRPWPNEWYVLEGRTSVDAFFRTTKAVVVIEGKRTEEGPTTDTTWMPVRHQILRNLDCAYEAFPGFQIWGFFIVEGNAPVSTDVPDIWKRFSKETISRSAVEGSLPHRSHPDQLAIAHAFLGVTTWQTVCDQFGIGFASLPDSADL
jgi:hypothetical protein